MIQKAADLLFISTFTVANLQNLQNLQEFTYSRNQILTAIFVIQPLQYVLLNIPGT